ncbi:hypothetical protein [Paraburkholderia elongata]|uniref:Metal ABC transporter ATPase n=1 Tax=Paraburkholderia elongata TaxID=2675747 RepID=A0A972NNG3_9BURK|nr:hypothetical protein [Paraburkholderia elongata]NPT56152.1 hypothetical protein [Paraburkholderia elongata]
MGVCMQIVYLGFAGTSQIEGEAATQLVRLERFSKSIAGCHLAIEAIRERPKGAGTSAPAADIRSPVFDARLDLIMRNGELVPIEHCLNADPDIAVRAAFDVAERKLDRRPI